MRFTLRWKILLVTVFTPLALTGATLWTVNRSLTQQVRLGIQDNLQRASLVFEKVFAARASKLDLAAQVIVRDPRFVSVMSIGGSPNDPHYHDTVERVARAFNDVAEADLFEVLDRRGRVLASVGRAASTLASRDAVVQQALRGGATQGILVDGASHYQVAAAPVRLDGQLQGVLLLGAGIGEPLARELRVLTHSEVTFASNGAITGSSFDPGKTRDAVLAALGRAPGMEQAAAGSPTSPRDGMAETPAPDGVAELRAGSHTYLTMVRPIPESRLQRGQLYVLQRSLDEETAFLQSVQGRLIRMGVVAALAAVLASIVIAERIARPVRRLVHGAEAMERGDYEFPLGKPGHDEIGYLTQRFAEMREHERAYILSLQETMRVKSEFIALASHELRTPISVIKGYHELFTAGGLGAMTPRQLKALEAIARSLGDLEKLAENATRMAQLEGGRPVLDVAPHTLEELFENAATQVVAEARGRNVEVTYHVDPDLGPVPVDGPRLCQVISNLLRNGIQYTPDGGHVELTGKRERDDVVIEVADDGVGIREERQSTLFEQPYAGRGSSHHHSAGGLEFNSSGLGLGLPIARGIVEAHGGTLTLLSMPGQGSTFTIRLPIPAEELRAAA